MGTSSKRRGGDAQPPARSKPHRKEKLSRSETVREPLTTAKRSAANVDENGSRNGAAAVPRKKNQKQIPVGGRRGMDTSLLARGMTARSVGIRVANHLKVVSPSEIERDIRHMEAYGAACVSYSQQLFAFSNRELVARGHYGPAPPAPGMTFTQPGTNGQQNGYAQPSVTMPVRIDPEEEKRLAILRKRVAASEAKREVLETEYLSLRAHYVHESHKLRRTRSAVTGQLKFLRELLKRRGDTLALRRVKCAAAKEILASLEYRAQAPQSGTSDVSAAPQDKGEPMSIDGSETTDPFTPEGSSVAQEGKSDAIPADLMDVWSLIESKLHEAELSCNDIQTPEELLYIKNALCADATALDAAHEATAVEKNRRSRSPVRFKDGEEEEVVEKEGGKKKKSRSERAAKRGTESGPFAFGKKVEMDKDENVIPWNCRVMPRTPHGVALYLSNLSSSPELAAAFACDTLFGSAPESFAWLESNLPASAIPGAQNDSEQLRKVKEEVENLQAELKIEVSSNSNLQRDAIEGRRQSDEICAMMTMIRSETEAIVHRHNQILVAKEMLDEENRDDSEGEHIEDDDDGTEVFEDDDGQDGFGAEDDVNAFENDDGQDGFGAEDNVNTFGVAFDSVDAQPVMEVIVPSQNVLSTNLANNKRVLSEEDELEKKRRKIM